MKIEDESGVEILTRRALDFHLINPRICETVPIPTVSVTNSAYPPASTTTYEEDEDETTTEEAPVSTSSDDDEDEATTEASVNSRSFPMVYLETYPYSGDI